MNALSLSPLTPYSGNGSSARTRAKPSITKNLFPRREGDAFRPPRGDIGKHQTVHERPLGHTATMLDKVNLEEPRLDVFPVGKGADWDLLAQCGVDRPSPPAACEPS